ncbi:MAG: hypothetical protein HYU52_01995 [Acidobacteria bacterium]|nr:hypothetical protein [Acidobacteriota bacterium]
MVLDGTEVKFFNGELVGEGAPVEPGWWMPLGVTRGSVRFAESMELARVISLRMRDTPAVLAVFAEMKSWLARVDKILSVKGLEGKSCAHFADKRISFDRLLDTDGKLGVEGNVLLGGGKGEGIVWPKFRRRDFVLEWERPKHEWRLINVRKWFDKICEERKKRG